MQPAGTAGAERLSDRLSRSLLIFCTFFGTFMGLSRARMGMPGRPLDVLEESLGDVVTVRLKSGEEYVGELAGYDQHMNVVLEPLIDDPDPESEPEQVRDITIIRGDNLVSIHP